MFAHSQISLIEQCDGVNVKTNFKKSNLNFLLHSGRANHAEEIVYHFTKHNRHDDHSVL